MLQYNNLKSVFNFSFTACMVNFKSGQGGKFKTKHIMYNEPFARGNNI